MVESFSIFFKFSILLSLLASTIILTFAIFESNSPSLTLNVKKSLPLYPASGVYTKSGALPLIEPCAGSVITL